MNETTITPLESAWLAIRNPRAMVVHLEPSQFRALEAEHKMLMSHIENMEAEIRLRQMWFEMVCNVRYENI